MEVAAGIRGNAVCSDSFYFGPHGNRCFCIIDEPDSRLIRDAGIIMCYPAGHEYFRAHRVFSRLARELAACGFSVLRFDYRGTGDSDGEAACLRLHDWETDIERACEALTDRVPVSNLTLVGMRLGASLAVRLAARRNDIASLVLWDMVADGSAYCSELKKLHAQMLADLERFPRRRKAAVASRSTLEFVGTEYSQEMRKDIALIDSSGFSDTGVTDVITISSGRSACPGRQLIESFAPRACASTHRLESGYGWDDARRAEEIIIDPSAVREIVTAMQVIH